MQAFLSPGIGLLGRFGFARKFQLLFLLFILPLAGSLLMIEQDYRNKLNLISGERAGVRQLLALDALDNLLAAQRDRAARWRATETNRQPTPATLAAAATQLAATSQGVAQSCEQASGSAQHTQRIAADSSRDSLRTTASIQQLNQRLNETAAALGRVSEQGQQIQLVVDTIRGVAEQTNLLALNAAIEAARAGEQGRGFAVVADEVRSLSQRTQSSTAQIAGTVDSLRSTVNEAVSLMEAACVQAQSDAQAVTGLGERLGEIASAVQSVTDTLAQIATAVDEQAITADEVSGNIQQVDQAAVRLLEGARSVNLAADTLSQGSKALSDNTARFRLS